MIKRRKISQSRARAMAAELDNLRVALAAAQRQYRPNVGDATHLHTINCVEDSKALVAVNIAQRLGFGVRVETNGTRIEFYAINPRDAS